MNEKHLVALFAAFAAGVAVGANWPDLQEKMGPMMQNAGGKMGDFYTAFGRMMGEMKEGFEDRLAEQKQKRRSAPSPEAAFMSNLSNAVGAEQAG